MGAPEQQSSLDALQRTLKATLGDDAYRAWLGEAVYSVEPDGAVLILLKTKFSREYVQNNFHSQIQTAANQVLKTDPEVRYKINSNASDSFSALRSPMDEGQEDFFVPFLSEVPLKDDVHLMAVAPFTLSKKESRTELVYENVNGMRLTITCQDKYGMMRAHDYDFVLMMESHLNEKANIWRSEMTKWRAGGEEGPMPEKPPRKYRPVISDIERFRKQRFGGRQYTEIEGMFDRLATTSAKVERTSRANRRVGSFNFISGYDVLMRTDTGKVLEVEVGIPDWIYDGIVRETVPTLKTMNPDYVLIEQPNGKFLYRLAKLEAGTETKRMPLSEVYMRSGSRMSQREYNRNLTNYIKQLEALEGEHKFPEYDFEIVGSNRRRELEMRYRAS